MFRSGRRRVYEGKNGQCKCVDILGKKAAKPSGYTSDCADLHLLDRTAPDVRTVAAASGLPMRPFMGIAEHVRWLGTRLMKHV